jgi:hypothetical protein
MAGIDKFKASEAMESGEIGGLKVAWRGDWAEDGILALDRGALEVLAAHCNSVEVQDVQDVEQPLFPASQL